MDRNPPPTKKQRLDEMTAGGASNSADLVSAGIQIDEMKNTTEVKAVPPEQTAPFPSELPFEQEHKISKFFVRECYPKYYDLILNR